MCYKQYSTDTLSLIFHLLVAYQGLPACRLLYMAAIHGVMIDMLNYPGVHRRKGTSNWHYRRRIQLDLVEHYGRWFLTHSQGASTHREACDKAKAWPCGRRCPLLGHGEGANEMGAGEQTCGEPWPKGAPQDHQASE